MNALISGYYGFGNAGDELILRSMVSALRSQRPDLLITVLSAEPGKTAQKCGVNAVARWSPFAVFRALWSCDVLISGGGGLFQDRTGNLSLYYYLALIFVACLMGKRTVLYSVGVNGLRAMNRRMTARIINATDIVTVRDRESGRLLSNWGVATEKIKIVADPVLQYGALKKHAAGAEPVIAFILRPGGTQPERAAAAVARVAAAVREKLGAKIVFIPFQQRYDQPFTNTVAALAGERITIVEWNDPEEVIRQIEGVDLVVSQRFHGLVLAVLAGIPPVGISEDAKVQRFMEEIGRPCFTGFKDYDAVLSFITESWQQKDTISRKMTEIRQQLEERAHETAGFIARVFAE